MGNSAELPEIIKNEKLFNGLSNDDILDLFEYSLIEKYTQGHILFKDKDPGSSLFIVKTGEIKIFKETSEGLAFEIARFTESDFFGEMSFIDNIPRSANAQVTKESILIQIDNEGFRQFAKKNPESAMLFYKNIMLESQKRIRKTNEKLVKNYEELLSAHNEISKNRNFLNNIINSSTEIIIVLDSNEKVLVFNSGAERILKYKSADFIERPIFSLFSLGSYSNLITEIAEKKNISSRDVVMVSSEGKNVITNFSACILNGTAEKKFGDGIVIVAQDITEKKMYERQLLQNEKMILLGKTVSEIVHDIKNPLTVIMLARDCIFFRFEELHDEDFDKDIGQIDKSVTRIENIVSNTLRFAKVVPTEKIEIDLCEVINNSIGVSKVGKKSRDIEILFTPFASSIHIIGNAGQLEQVFVNLLTNAIYAIAQDIRGKISIDAVQSNNGKVRITVTDNGAGIPAEVLHDIFEPFFTTKPQGEGTGLGLSICQAIISQHGGLITCHSTVGQGTTFVIDLPLVLKTDKLVE